MSSAQVDAATILDPSQETHDASTADLPVRKREGISNEVEKETRAEKRRRKAQLETLVIVRPPPSKVRHPLLQIQLVTPRARNDSSASSAASISTSGSRPSSSAGGAKLDRVKSISSQKSTTSTSRILPLYNLHFYTLLSSTIYDAGTDQRVAKFTKNGVEIDGLGVMESRVIGSENRLDKKKSRSSGALRPRKTAKSISSPSGAGSNVLFPSVSRSSDGAALSSSGAKDKSSSLGGKLIKSFKKLGRPNLSAEIGGKVENPPSAISKEMRIEADRTGVELSGYIWTFKKLTRHIRSSTHLPVNEGEENLTLGNAWKRFHPASQSVNAEAGNDSSKALLARPPQPKDIPIRFEWIRDSSSSTIPPSSPEIEVDPDEDSETSWSFFLVMSDSVRIPLGLLSPAPHHPKVVAQLAVTFPLPDLAASGIGQDQAGFTREELKDIISCSALFLMVDEGFGGLSGSKKKNNSSWR